MNSEELIKTFENLLSFASRNVCLHEDTYRGGAIWEICSSCGMKWADDEGGKPENVHEEPKEICDAYSALTFLKTLLDKTENSMIPQKNKKYAICGYPQGASASETLFKGVLISEGVLGNSEGYYYWFREPGKTEAQLFKREDIIAEIPDFPELQDCIIYGADVTHNTITVKLQSPKGASGVKMGKNAQISF